MTTNQYTQTNGIINRQDTLHKKNYDHFNFFNTDANGFQFNGNNKNETGQSDNVNDMVLDTIHKSTVLKSSEEQDLSQKFIKLCTTETVANEQSAAYINIKNDLENIPNYLTKRNKSFQEILCQALSTIEISMTKRDRIHALEELRKIAITIYKMMAIEIYHLLWTTYLKSGIGQLINSSPEKNLSYSTTTSIWPKQIKLLVKLTNKNEPNDMHEFYLKFVQDQLYQLNQQSKQFQIELDSIIKNLRGYALTVHKIIQTYVKQNLHSFRMDIEHQIELIHYDYHIRALKLEYLRHNPNQYQEQLMNEVCQSKYTQELTEQEYHLVKQKITYYTSAPSQSFDSSSIARALLDDFSRFTRDEDIQQDYYQRCKTVTEKCRADLFAMHMEEIEHNREEYKKKYDACLKKIFSSQHSSFNNEKEKKLSPIMIQLIDQRCQKISERIKCINKFKAQSFL